MFSPPNLVPLPLMVSICQMFGCMDQNTDMCERVMPGASCLRVRVGCHGVHSNVEHQAQDWKGNYEYNVKWKG